MEETRMPIWMMTFEGPLGPLLMMSNGKSLIGVHTDIDKHRPAIQPDWVLDDNVAPFAQTIAQLRAYFDGSLTEFSLPLAPQGTAFQMTVWRELRNIPYGKTISYAELARRIGRPSASRAVGHANARNPISIIVPASTAGAGIPEAGPVFRTCGIARGPRAGRLPALISLEAGERTHGSFNDAKRVHGPVVLALLEVVFDTSHLVGHVRETHDALAACE
jgi:methylated-DNA-[protein]-cysteine S-methyltransferase